MAALIRIGPETGSGAPCVYIGTNGPSKPGRIVELMQDEDFDTVLSDVLGSPPCASSLPIGGSRFAAFAFGQRHGSQPVPFAACPELLCIDRERHVHDRIEYPDFFWTQGIAEGAGRGLPV